MKTKFHLDNPLDGEQNMRFDGSFFRQLNKPLIISAPGCKPYLSDQSIVRIYEWSRPTLSLGIAQKKNIFNSKLQQDDIKVVHRITGGRVVLHYQEITYAVIGIIGGFWGNTLHDTYTKISDILKQFLANLGVYADAQEEEDTTSPNRRLAQSRSLSCYDAVGFKEVSIGGKKLIGSAQKRGQYAFLQHGSIPYYRHNLRVEDYLASPYQPSGSMKEYIFVDDFIRTPIADAKEVLKDTFKSAFAQKPPLPSKVSSVPRHLLSQQ